MHEAKGENMLSQKFLIGSIIALVSVLLFGFIAASADPMTPSLISETFSYSDGNLVGNGGWTNHSGTGSLIQVISEQAIVTHGSGSREDANRSFDEVNSGVVAATFEISVDDLGSPYSGSNNQYFLHFKDGNTFTTRVAIVEPTSFGDYSLGIASQTDNYAVTTTDFNFGETVPIYIAFDIDIGQATMTIGAETLTGAIAGTGKTISEIALRQGDSSEDETIRIDSIEVWLEAETIDTSTGAGTYQFPNNVATIVVNDAACEPTSITVDLTTAAHPNVQPTMPDPRYWTITQTGCSDGDFSLDITLPHENVTNPHACRFSEGAWISPCISPSSSSTTEITFNTTSLSDIAINEGPTAVELEYFTATNTGVTITLDWETSQEINHAGFNILRRAAHSREPWTQVNEELIASVGTQAQGAVYTFVDTSVTSGTWEYLLEDIETDGDKFQHTEFISTVTIQIPTSISLIDITATPNVTIMSILISSLIIIGLSILVVKKRL